MTRYLLSSHDGFGLGHVRRNALIARALLRREPGSVVTIVTGTEANPPWLDGAAFRVERVPPLLKDHEGVYRNPVLPIHAALAERARRFREVVNRTRPDVVLVDRHPYGIGGELRDGLDVARRAGAALVIGLRDVLDEPNQIRAELAGAGWEGVAERFAAVLVYGERVLCDHEAEYGLDVTPEYCGLVAPPRPCVRRGPARELIVAAGGGGDGKATFELAVSLLAQRVRWRATVLAGPYAQDWLASVPPDLAARMTLLRNVDGCAPFFALGSATLQMAGYNSTVEALAAGVRPMLVPRRSPRREQAIRATRLAALGLADIVDAGADAAEIAWLLERDRFLAPDACADAGLGLDGATRAAARLGALVRGQVSR